MIDLRSDTVTRPLASMRKAMADAETGDDVLREDPTVLKLEKRAAELTGMEAALFTPSGTFANQLSLFTWCPRGGEVYLNEATHIVQHEAGSSAYLSGVFLRAFPPNNGQWVEWDDILPRFRTVRNQHFPVPSLVCLENALSNGMVQPVPSMAAVKSQCENHGIPLHLDGARLFNAALSLGVEAETISRHSDSVMFCLSKGLGAPVGSILCGSRDFIEEAFYKRKIMGGGMRQVGILAAAGLVALKEELPRLAEDHHLACEIASALMGFDDVFHLHTPKPAINIVFMSLRKGGLEREQRFHQLLTDAGILIYPPEKGIFRFVTHRDVNAVDLRHSLNNLHILVEQLK